MTNTMQQQHAALPVAWPAAPPPELLESLGPTAAFFLDTYRRHGPAVRLRLGPGKELVVLSGLEANLFLSRSGQRHVRMADFRHAQNQAYGAVRTMVSSDGVEHRRLRKLQKRGYSRDVLAHQGAAIAALVAEEQTRWSGEPVVAAATRLSGRLIGGCVLGYDPGAGVAELTTFLQTVIRTTLASNLAPSALDQPTFLQTRQHAYTLAADTVAAHGCPAHQQRRSDLVDDLLDAANLHPELFCGDDLRVAVLGPYIGGLEPVANSLAFALFALAHERALATRVQAEVRANLDNPADCLARIELMPTLRGLVQETLRRYPVTPVQRGTATRDFVIGGCLIEAGTEVAFGIAVPHFLPELFPDPLRFDIDRFGGASGGQRRPGSYAPFGLGSHACLGAGLAEALLQAILAVTLFQYDLALDPPDYRLRIVSITTPAPDPAFRLRLTDRPSA
jgi:cytochrome P450